MGGVTVPNAEAQNDVAPRKPPVTFQNSSVGVHGQVGGPYMAETETAESCSQERMMISHLTPNRGGAQQAE